jgi:hypothetical protein
VEQFRADMMLVRCVVHLQILVSTTVRIDVHKPLLRRLQT